MMTDAEFVREVQAYEKTLYRVSCGGAHSMSQRGVYGKERDNTG